MAQVAALGVLTGWGEGTGALPADAARAAGERRVVALARPALDGERFRRATRECLLGVAAVEAMLRDGGLGREDVRGQRTALVYVTAAAYGASNLAFVQGAGGQGTLHFPYTAPSAVPAEVAIEFGLTGGYVILIGAAPATLDGLWQAATLLARGRCDRALVLAVETFEECADLYARGRWLSRGPLVEAAACALLVPGGVTVTETESADSALATLARRRAGETLACEPLLALALARDGGRAAVPLTGQWRGRRAGLRLSVLERAASA
jgi:3-oxoacyl-[acyl-carrier-protein] synthase III